MDDPAFAAAFRPTCSLMMERLGPTVIPVKFGSLTLKEACITASTSGSPGCSTPAAPGGCPDGGGPPWYQRVRARCRGIRPTLAAITVGTTQADPRQARELARSGPIQDLHTFAAVCPQVAVEYSCGLSGGSFFNRADDVARTVDQWFAVVSAP